VSRPDKNKAKATQLDSVLLAVIFKVKNFALPVTIFSE
jgi:hypothetical protein